MKNTIFLSLAFLLVASAMANCKIIFVDADATGSNDGSTWADAYNYLQDGLAASSSGDEIWVAKGVYKPDEDSAYPAGTGNRRATFQIISGVTIKGGYAGFGEQDPDARSIDENQTILSGNIGSRSTSWDNSYHVVTASRSVDATAQLDGLIITAGNTKGSGNKGGGMSCSGSPTLINCTFSENKTSTRAGGLYINESSPTLINCKFIRNYAMWGGAIWNYFGSPVLINCMFMGNSAEGSGGAIDNYTHGNLTLINCTLSGNRAVWNGGGIYSAYRVTLTLTNCILWGNTDRGGRDESAQISGNTDAISVNYCCIQGWTGSIGGIGNIGIDPLLEADGYHLQAGSPCINAGDPVGHYSSQLDVDGQPRVIGGLVDIGVDEFVYTPKGLIGLEILGLEEVVENSSAQYVAIARYQDDSIPEVTNSTVWWVDSVSHGRIDANGLLTTRDMETLEYITIYAQYTEEGITVEAEYTVEIYSLVGLDILGPSELRETCHAQYKAVASYNNGKTMTVTGLAEWLLEPNSFASIEAGLLQLEEIDIPQDIMLYADYIEGGAGAEAAMSVHVIFYYVPYTLRVPEEYGTIQAGIDSATDGDIVMVADGTYTGPGNRDIDFLGKAITIRSESGPENCIIDCEGLGRGFHFHSGENYNSILDGFTVTNGSNEKHGGAIYSNLSSPTVNRCIFTNNFSGWKGGAVHGRGSSIMLTNCLFYQNKADWGGAVHASYVYGSSQGPILINCTVVDNYAYNRFGGGGVYCGSTGKTTLTNCIVWGNRYDGEPGFPIDIERAQLKLPNPVVNYSCIEGLKGTFGGIGNIDQDPCFALITDYHLMPNSPCIDTGNPNYVAEPDETDIDGNPRVIGGRIDMGAYETNYIQAAMKFTPQALNCNSKGKYVKAHLTLPEEFLPEDVDVNESAIAEPMGAESEYIKVLGAGTGSVRLEITFDREAFCDSVTETGEVEITVIGSLTTDQYFYATDTIKIKPRR